MRKSTTFGLICCIIGLTAGMLWLRRADVREWWWQQQQPALPAAISANELPALTNQASNQPVNEPANAPEDISANVAPVVALPAELNLAVPFTTQAPAANWDATHEEACEEAAILMAYHWLQGTDIKTDDQAETELQQIIAFENRTLGYFEDTTVAETRQIMIDLWQVPEEQVVLSTDVTADRIKHELAAGHLVLVPTYGRGLGNPNYKAPGPLYHFLVIKGYTATQFITNDPGTRRGADYVYDDDVLLNAVHDWNDGDVPQGEQIMLIVQQE